MGPLKLILGEIFIIELMILNFLGVDVSLALIGSSIFSSLVAASSMSPLSPSPKFFFASLLSSPFFWLDFSLSTSTFSVAGVTGVFGVLGVLGTFAFFDGLAPKWTMKTYYYQVKDM